MSSWVDWSAPLSPSYSVASLIRDRERMVTNLDHSAYVRHMSSKRIRSLQLSTSLEIRNALGAVNCMSLEAQESRYLLCGGLYGTISLTDLESIDTSVRDSGAKVAKNVWVGHGSSSTSDRTDVANRGFGGLMISSLEWYPQDSGMFISALSNGSLSIWDTNELTVAYTFNLGANILTSKIRGYESGALIAVGLSDNKIKLCDTRTGDSCMALQGHSAGVSAVDWCPSSIHQLASASLDGTMKVWDVRRGGDNPPIMSFDWLQDHTTVARYGAVFNTVDGVQSRNPAVHHASRTAGAQVRQGMSNASAHAGGRTSLEEDGLHQWTVDRQKEKIAKAHVGGVFSMKYTPCGRFLVSAGADQRVRLWESGSGRLKPINYDLQVPGNAQSRLPYEMEIATFSSAGDDLLLFPDGTEGDIAIVPLHSPTGLPIRTLKGHLGMPSSLIYRKPYHQILSAGKDGMVFLWDPKLEAPVRKRSGDVSPSLGGAVNLELSIDVDAMHGASGDYWSDDEPPAIVAGAEQGSAPISGREGPSLGAARRFLPPIIRRYLDDAQQRRGDAPSTSSDAAAVAAAAAAGGVAAAARGASEKKLKVVDLRAKYGRGARKRARAAPTL